MLLQKLRRSDQSMPAASKHLHDKIAILQRRKARPYRHIETFTDHIDAAICTFEMNIDLRVGSHEAAEHVADMEIDKRGRATELDKAAGLGAELGDGIVRGIGLDQHGNAVAIVFLADLRDGKAPRRALHEPYTQPILQHGNPPAKPGFRHAERSRSGREAAMINGLHKEIEIVEVSHCPNDRTLKPKRPG